MFSMILSSATTSAMMQAPHSLRCGPWALCRTTPWCSAQRCARQSAARGIAMAPGAATCAINLVGCFSAIDGLCDVRARQHVPWDATSPRARAVVDHVGLAPVDHDFRFDLAAEQVHAADVHVVLVHEDQLHSATCCRHHWPLLALAVAAGAWLGLSQCGALSPLPRGSRQTARRLRAVAA